MRTGVVVAGLVVLVLVGLVLYYRKALSKPSAPADDWKAGWDARLASLRGVLGAPDDTIMTSPVPFYLDGGADVLTFREHLDGVVYVTAGPIGDGRAKPNELGQYELMMCLRKDAEWAPKLLSQLARYTTEAVLKPGETMDIAPALPQPTELTHLLFLPYSRIKVAGKPAGILLCIGITREEFDRLQKRGRDAAVKDLKDAGVYPFTDVSRTSVEVAH